MLAALSGDAALSAAATAGDLYEAVAGDGFGGDRAHAKVALLGAMYGATTGESGRLLGVLFDRYPRAMALVEGAARAGERAESVRSVLGRASPPPGAWWREATQAGSLPEATDAEQRRARQVARDWGRFTRNFVIQASAADWAAVWLSGLRAALLDLPGAELVFFQHDEVIVHVPQELADDAAAMATATAARGQGPGVPRIGGAHPRPGDGGHELRRRKVTDRRSGQRWWVWTAGGVWTVGMGAGRMRGCSEATAGSVRPRPSSCWPRCSRRAPASRHPPHPHDRDHGGEHGHRAAAAGRHHRAAGADHRDLDRGRGRARGDQDWPGSTAGRTNRACRSTRPTAGPVGRARCPVTTRCWPPTAATTGSVRTAPWSAAPRPNRCVGIDAAGYTAVVLTADRIASRLRAGRHVPWPVRPGRAAGAGQRAVARRCAHRVRRRRRRTGRRGGSAGAVRRRRHRRSARHHPRWHQADHPADRRVPGPRRRSRSADPAAVRADGASPGRLGGQRLRPCWSPASRSSSPIRVG